MASAAPPEVLRPAVGRASLTRHGLTLAYLLDPEDTCNGFEIEQGEPPSDHAAAGDYSRDDVLDQFRYADCPLHLTPDYPAAPEGVWKRDVARAGERLAELTRTHLGLEPTSKRLRHGPMVATAAEVEQLWRDFPHARWWWERAARQAPPEDRRFDVELIEE